LNGGTAVMVAALWRPIEKDGLCRFAIGFLEEEIRVTSRVVPIYL
jgi:hypothetical protein